MQSLNELFRQRRYEAVPVDVPVPVGFREKVLNAIDALRSTAEQDCYDTNQDSCQCSPCMAKHQINELQQIFFVDHKSINPDRHCNLFERIFSEKWRQMNSPDRHSHGYSTLELILSPTRPDPDGKPNWPKGGVTYVPPITPRDAQVAATVIQWLGTGIGSSFLRECEREIESKRKATHLFFLGLTTLGLKDIPEDIALGREIASQLCPADHPEFETLVTKLANAIQQSADHLVKRSGSPL